MTTQENGPWSWKRVIRWGWAVWMRRSRDAQEQARLETARAYLKGSGVEIGALHKPLRVRREVRVTYVDRAPVEELRKHYPEFAQLPLAPVAIISHAETLEGIPDASQDFVIANHVIEHMEDPILALKNWLRVLRLGGLIYLVLPDKRFTFDWAREVTSIEHLMKDHLEGPHVSRRNHYREWAVKVEGLDPGAADIRAKDMERERVNIHYHVWGTPAFTKFLLHLRAALKFPMEIELLRRNGNETIFVLSRSEKAPAPKSELNARPHAP